MPAAAHAVGPRYPISGLPSKSGPRLAAAPDPPLVTDTATSCDYPRHSHRKPAGQARQRSRSARRDISPAKRPSRREVSWRCGERRSKPPFWLLMSARRAAVRSGRLAEVVGRDLVEELTELLDLV